MVSLKKKSTKDILVYTVFFLMGIFPILPYKLKPIVLIYSLFIGFFFFLRNRKVEYSNIYLFNGLLFILYAISLLYSNDIAYAVKRLETSLALIVLPFIFILISSIIIDKKQYFYIKTLFFITFYISVIVLSIVMYIYVYSIGYFDNLVSYSFSLSYIEHRLWIFKDHPIYISIYMAIALILSFKIYKLGSKQIKILVLVGNLLILSSLFFLSRKGVIIPVLLSLAYLTYKTILNISKIRLLYLGVVFIGVTLFFALSSSHSKRIFELFNIETYTNSVNENLSSTSIRLAIYKCCLKQIPEAGLLGFGIGDVKESLEGCYKNTSSLLLKTNYNTHNQYFNTLLATGFLGLIGFILILYKLFKLSIISKDYIFTSILIFYVFALLTENILDRQNGIMLFCILINYFTFKNLLKRKFNG